MGKWTSLGFTNGKIETIDVEPGIVVPFMVKGEGLTDSVSTSYELAGGNSPLKRLVVQAASKYLGEPGLVRKNTGQQPKTLSLALQWRASKTRSGKYSTGFTINDIQRYVGQLQALCCQMIRLDDSNAGAYEKIKGTILFSAGRAFPLCRLVVAGLYDLNVVVTQVAVTWSNLWRMSSGKPMGADVNLGVEVHYYYTYAEMMGGRGFYVGGF